MKDSDINVVNDSINESSGSYKKIVRAKSDLSKLYLIKVGVASVEKI